MAWLACSVQSLCIKVAPVRCSPDSDCSSLLCHDDGFTGHVEHPSERARAESRVQLASSRRVGKLVDSSASQSLSVPVVAENHICSSVTQQIPQASTNLASHAALASRCALSAPLSTLLLSKPPAQSFNRHPVGLHFFHNRPFRHCLTATGSCLRNLSRKCLNLRIVVTFMCGLTATHSFNESRMQTK